MVHQKVMIASSFMCVMCLTNVHILDRYLRKQLPSYRRFKHSLKEHQKAMHISDFKATNFVKNCSFDKNEYNMDTTNRFSSNFPKLDLSVPKEFQKVM